MTADGHRQVYRHVGGREEKQVTRRITLLAASALMAATLGLSSFVAAQSVCVTYQGHVCGGDGLCCAAIRQFCIEWPCDY